MGDEVIFSGGGGGGGGGDGAVVLRCLSTVGMRGVVRILVIVGRIG